MKLLQTQAEIRDLPFSLNDRNFAEQGILVFPAYLAKDAT